MAIQLTGEVGRTGRAEDVAVAQALLANIKGPNGRPLWDRAVDGRPGAELAAAIQAFQRRWVEVAVAGGSVDIGVVAPGSRTLQALTSLAPRSLDGLRAAAVSPVLLYAQDDPQGRAARSHANAAKVPGATVVNLAAIQQAQALLAQRRRLAVKIGKSGLAGDRWGFRVALDGLTVVEADGRPRTVDDRPESAPAAVWRLVDGQFAGFFEAGGSGELAGPGVYRSRTPLASLRASIDEELLLRMEVPRPSRHETVRLTSAALGLVAGVRSLTREGEDELRQLIAMVKGDDPATARLLEERWRSLRNGLNASNVRYVTREQLRQFLKERSEYDRLLELAGALATVLQTASDAADAAPDLAGRASAPAAALLTLANILSGGAENEAERLYEERRKAAQPGGSSIAGISVPPGRSRRDFLLTTFRILPTALRLDPVREATLLDLMQRILELQRTDGRGTRRIEDEIYREWGRYPFLERLLDVYRNVREAITNPINARFRPDDQLAKYRKRLAATAMVVDIAGKLALLRDVYAAAKNPRDVTQWGAFGDLLLEILQVSNDRALDVAKAELDRRIAAL